MTTKDAPSPPSLDALILESERGFRALTEHLADAIVLLNADGVMTYASPPTQQVLGYAPHDLEGQGVFAFMHPADAGLLDHAFADLLDHPGQHITHDLKCKRQDGTWIWVEVKATNLLHDPAVQAIVATFRDITARKMASEQLQFHARIAQSQFDAVVATDPHYQIIIWNEAAERLYGWTANEVIGTNATNPPMPPTDFPNHGDHGWQEELQAKGYWHGEVIQTRKDGTSFPALSSISAVKDDTGIVLGFVAVNHDITDRKQMEEKLSQLATIVENSGDSIFGKTLDGIVTSWNKGAEELYGFTADEMVGRSIEIIVPTDRRRELWQVLARIRAGQSIAQFDTVRIRKDGQPIDVSITFSPIKNSLGQIVGISTIGRDVTARMELERRKDDFINAAGHELRTPLTSLQGFIYLLQQRLETYDDKKAQFFLSRMSQIANNMTNLVIDLLDVQKIQKGDLELHKDVFLIDDLVDEVIDNIKYSTTTHEIAIEGKTEGEVFGDRERLGEVLTNLLANAIKYSPDADKVIVRRSVEGDTVTVAVEDFGVGIDKEYHEKVFQRFFRVRDDAAATFPGMGIGLYISAQLVQRHGGRLWVKSTKGIGSTFFVALPLMHARRRSKRQKVRVP